jgi:CheY-like chemotaxis protein
MTAGLAAGVSLFPESADIRSRAASRKFARRVIFPRFAATFLRLGTARVSGRTPRISQSVLVWPHCLGVDEGFGFRLAATATGICLATLERRRVTISPCEPGEIEARLQCFDIRHTIPCENERGPGSRKYRLKPGSRGESYTETEEEFVKIGGSLISVVDDDESVRESLPGLLQEFGFTAKVFSSAEEFLSSDSVQQTQCLILDITMPGMSGPDLQQELAHRQVGTPIIFITASSNSAVRMRLLKQGAVECLFKPFADSALLNALNAALAKS